MRSAPPYPTATQSSHASPPEHSVISRWSFRASLLAFLFAAVYILLILIWRLAALPVPAWAPAAVAIAPAIDVMLAGAGAALNLGEMLQIARRTRAFDPHESGKEFALDDAGELLTLLRPGCAARLTIPLALIVSMIALLLGLLPLPGVDNLQVHPGQSLQSCTATLAPFTFEVDNAGSTIDVAWSAAPVEMVSDGTPWATLQPAQGTLKPGQRTTVNVVPNVLVCQVLTRRGGAIGATGARASAAVSAASAPAATAYHVQVTSTGKTHRTKTLTMSLTTGDVAPTPTPVPTVTPTDTSTYTPTIIPTATPTATVAPPPPPPPPPAPHAALEASPTQTGANCSGGSAPSYTVTLNNSDSNVSVGWQYVAAEHNSATPWAVANPPSGTVAAGQTAILQVVPQSWYCPPPSAPATVWGGHASLHLIFPQGGAQGDIALFDAITGPLPPPAPNLFVTQNSVANQTCNQLYPAGPYTVTLRNTGNVPVTWRFDPVQFNGAPNPSWASASKTTGTVGVNGTDSFDITPDPALCPPAGSFATWTGLAYLRLSFPQGGSQPDLALTDNITYTPVIF